jgi:hypothetical protein
VPRAVIEVEGDDLFSSLGYCFWAVKLSKNVKTLNLLLRGVSKSSMFARAAAVRQLQNEVKAALAKDASMLRSRLSEYGRITILLTRYGRRLGSDNLVGGCKAVRDAVADVLIPGLAPGRADDDSRLFWAWNQVTSKRPTIKISLWRNIE